jgi:mono/diheme cytochrome c family protein
MTWTRLAGTAGLLGATITAVFDAPAAAGEVAGPAVAGFQRFHADGEGDLAAGGRLLLGELNCTACHAADGSLAAWLAPKPAPVLDSVATRVKPEYLRRFLADPQATDPGTTMPHLFAGVDAGKRSEQVEALVHFLASGGAVQELRSDPAAAKRGDNLFHTIGCAVCHGARRDGAERLATDVPFGDLAAKYGIAGLAEFLRDPHVVRPGGRMPDFDLDEKQALDVAHFLIPDSNPKPKDPRVTYNLYEGSYGTLPDFETLEPDAEGQADGLDVFVAGDGNNYALVFEGFLKIDRAGEYWFQLGSDDGSRLVIDGETVANNDGVHAFMSVRGAKTLEEGVYPIRVEYAQVGGERKLTLDFEGPGVPKQPVVNATYLNSEATRIETMEVEKSDENGPFRPDPPLAEKGRELFASLGCANCHQKKEGDSVIASTKTAPPLGDLAVRNGCLTETPAAPAVNYGLTAGQRASIAAALAQPPAGSPSDVERIDAALVRFNCYGCHERGGKGGVEGERNELFTTTIPEMGDEGRIPPHLAGVGDKLTGRWLRRLLDEGANDREYMRTRMPSFGSDNVGFLADAFAVVDARTEVTAPALDLPKHRVESVGRQLAGESALSCVKCHDFGEYAGTGIRAIDLQTMARRLRQDWFFRYMPDPQTYRPGTRMPSGFYEGKSAVRNVLDGDANAQLAALWTYLERGRDAPPPPGAIGSSIVLAPKDRPIIYRNFLEGLSARGIAVGYPEKANLAFDAEAMCLALIWHNDFIDAAKHWRGRGSGTQRPLGDHVLSLVRGAPLAVLPEDATPWPSAPAKEQGWRFRGYRLDSAGRPRFRYGTNSFSVEDASQPIPADVAGTSDPVLHRTVTVSAVRGASLPDRLYFRVAAGQKIEEVGGRNYTIDDALTVRLSPHPDEPSPVVRESEGGRELLIPIRGGGDMVKVEIDYEW